MAAVRLAPLLALGAAGACGGANDVVYTADQVVVYEPDSALASTTTLPTPDGPVVIERIWSPENEIAEVLGFGAIATDAIAVDDGPAELVTFDIDASGSFTLRVRIGEAGAHSVCIRDECGRVFVELAPSPDDAGG